MIPSPRYLLSHPPALPVLDPGSGSGNPGFTGVTVFAANLKRPHLDPPLKGEEKRALPDIQVPGFPACAGNDGHEGGGKWHVRGTGPTELSAARFQGSAINSLFFQIRDLILGNSLSFVFPAYWPLTTDH
jgi:hypothetical protein